MTGVVLLVSLALLTPRPLHALLMHVYVCSVHLHGSLLLPLSIDVLPESPTHLKLARYQKANSNAKPPAHHCLECPKGVSHALSRLMNGGVQRDDLRNVCNVYYTYTIDD